MSDQTDHSAAAAAPYRHEITISVGGEDSEDRIQIKTPPSVVTTPTPSPRSMQSTTDEISTNSTEDDNVALASKHKTTPNGVDNLAFENDHNNKTSQQRQMSSFTSNGNNGMTEKANGNKNGMDKPLAEAVNLELVNLNKVSAANGHRDNGLSQKKKESTQVDIGGAYNEYFVPVNEHKKYMRERGLHGVDQNGRSINETVEGLVDYNSWRKVARGEKLYVTKDKRLKATNWRKRLCWIIGLALCVAVIIVAFLLASGTIVSEPEPIESRQFGKDNVNAAGVFGSGGKRRQNDTYSSTPQQPGSTVSPDPPSTEEHIKYVPNTIDGRFKIENSDFMDEYKDHDSPIYHEIVSDIESGIMESLQSFNNVHVKVFNLSSGSIVVDYRVTWDEEELLSKDIFMNTLSEYLKENHGYISKYFVPTETLSYTEAIDTCAMDPNAMQCEHGCEFDKESLDFKCIHIKESEPEPELVKESVEVESEHPSSEPEPEIQIEHEDVRVEFASSEPEPDISSENNEIKAETPSSEPEPEITLENKEAKAEPPSSEPEAEITSEKNEAKAEPSSNEPEPEIVSMETEAKPEPPSSEPEPEITSNENESKPEREPEIASKVPEAKPEPPSSEPEPEITSNENESEPEREPEVASKEIEVKPPSIKPEPETLSESNEAKAEPPSSEPEPEIASKEIKAKPEYPSSEPEPEIQSESNEAKVEPPSSEPEPEIVSKEMEAKPEPPSSEPEPEIQMKHEDVKAEPPSSEPEPEKTSERNEAKAESPSSEPESEKTSERNEAEAESSSSEPEPEIASKEMDTKPEPPSSEPEPEITAEEKDDKIPKSEPAFSSTEEMLKAEPVSEPSAVSIDLKEQKMVEESMENTKRKIGKELSFNEGSQKNLSSTTESVSSTTSKQIFTYDFEQGTSAEREEVHRVSVSSVQSASPIGSEKVAVVPVHTMITEILSTSEQPAPVTEDLSDDTPMPTTENYFKSAKSIEEQTEKINIMDGSTASKILKPATHTIYSTTAPIKIEYDEASGSRSLPSNSNPTYSVTENIYEQSPYLPESENGETFLNILHANNDEFAQNDTDDLKTKDLDDVNFENDNDSANLISDSENKAEKSIQSEEKSSDVKSTSESSKIMSSIDETEISDSTEIYHLQESRTHNHEKFRPQSIVGVDSTEMSMNSEEDESTITTMIFVESSSSSTKLEPIVNENSTDQMDSTTIQQRSNAKNMEAISSDPSIEPSNVPENEPTSEPSSDITSEPNQPSSTESNVQISISFSKPTSSLQEKTDEIIPSPEPTINESAPTTAPPLSDVSSQTETATENKIVMEAITSEKSDIQSSTNETATNLPTKEGMKVDDEPMPTTWAPSNETSTEHQKKSEDKLKVIPLTDPTTIDPHDLKETSTETQTVQSSEKESIESTTGHFLSNATFQLISKSVGTSLNSSDVQPIKSHVNNDNDNVTPIQSLISSTEKTNFIYSNCTAGQFECKNGTSIKDGGSCINLSERCDSITHCTDHSDEFDCQTLGCPGHFQCKDGSCLARSRVCNGIVDCVDASDEDESLCSDWKCKFDEITCGEKGPCLPAIFQCDGIQHCANQADETNCADTCKSNEFYCSWQRKCIPETWLCDGKVDCSGGEDERSCDCSEGYFKCRTGRCVPDQYVCDGTPQCADRSDDWDCFNITKIKYLTSQTIDDGFNAIEFRANAVQIKIKNAYAFVCFENWNSKYSDKLCENLGYARSKDYSFVEMNTTNASVVKVSGNATKDSILMDLNETFACAGNQIVTLDCEIYDCGNEITRDEHAIDKVQTWPTTALAINENSSSRCTATILSPRWALASYSCIFGKFDMNGEIVNSSSWRLQVNVDSESDESHTSIKRIYKYPQTKFKQFLYSGNVVLLQLNTSIKFNENVTAACISDEPIDSERETCITVGWPMNKEFDSGNHVKKLNELLISSNNCNSTLNYAGSLPDDTMCIENDDAVNNTNCTINSGASLICYSSTKSSWQLKGILSYQNDCQRHNLPLLYTKITDSLLEWITKTIGNDRNRLNTKP